VLVRLDDAVVTAVKDLQQTVVAEIKAVTADGKISEAEKQRIKDAAVANVKSYLRCRRSPKGESHANPPLPPEDTMQRAAALSCRRECSRHGSEWSVGRRSADRSPGGDGAGSGRR
jgi:hypothetical protein